VSVSGHHTPAPDEPNFGPTEVVLNDARYVREETLFAAMREVETLRAERDQFEREADSESRLADEFEARAREARAEVETLRAERDDERAEHTAQLQALDAQSDLRYEWEDRARVAEAEVETLRAERDEARQPWPGSVKRFMDRAYAAEAELAEIRQALEQIASRHPDAAHGEHPAVDIARAALAVSSPPHPESQRAPDEEPSDAGGRTP
jgi:chromosome segregation ATPase